MTAQGIPTQRAETVCPAPFMGSPVAKPCAPNTADLGMKAWEWSK